MEIADEDLMCAQGLAQILAPEIGHEKAENLVLVLAEFRAVAREEERQKLQLKEA